MPVAQVVLGESMIPVGSSSKPTGGVRIQAFAMTTDGSPTR